MNAQKCSVPGCNKTRADNTILHLFPDPEKEWDRFFKWIYVIGGNLLVIKPNSIFKNGRVCHIHFDEKYYTVSGRISRNAVPTLHLSEMDDDNISKEPPMALDSLKMKTKPCTSRPFRADIPDEVAKEIDTDSVIRSYKLFNMFQQGPTSPTIGILKGHSKVSGDSEPHLKRGSPCPPSPSASPEYTEIEYIDSVSDNESICDEKPIAFEFVNIAEPGTSKQLTPEIPDVALEQFNSASTLKTYNVQKFQQTPIKPMATSTSTPALNGPIKTPGNTYERSLRGLPLNKSHQSTQTDPDYLSTTTFHFRVELKQSKMEIKRYKRQVCQLENRVKQFKEKLNRLRKSFHRDIIDKFTKKMKPAARVFTKMQYTQAAKSANGRRFTDDEKMLALSIYNCSSTSYRILQKFFMLPSVRSTKLYWRHLQNKINENQEINPKLNEDYDDLDVSMSDDNDSVHSTNDLDCVNQDIDVDVDDESVNNDLIVKNEIVVDNEIIVNYESVHVDSESVNLAVCADKANLPLDSYESEDVKQMPQISFRNIKTFSRKGNSNQKIIQTGNMALRPVNNVQTIQNVTHTSAKSIIKHAKLHSGIDSSLKTCKTGNMLLKRVNNVQNIGNVTHAPAQCIIKRAKTNPEDNSSQTILTAGNINLRGVNNVQIIRNSTQPPPKCLIKLAKIHPEAKQSSATCIIKHAKIQNSEDNAMKVHGSNQLQSNDLNESSYQQRLDLALSGLSYDMPQLEY